MLVAIGAVVGIPAWIMLGWLLAGIWRRHEIKQLPDLFKTKVRMISGPTGIQTPTFRVQQDTQYGHTTY